MEFKDYYDILGVSKDTNEADVKSAYRKLARKYHPDRNKDAGAEDKFKSIGEAYEVLKDKKKRAAYDQLQAGGYRNGDQFRPPPDWGNNDHFDYGDLGGGHGGAQNGEFSDFFESLFGQAANRQRGRPRAQRGQDVRARIQVELETAYQGGKTRVSMQDPGGQERVLEVNIPAGIESGKMIRLGGQGNPGYGGGPSGDLLLEISVRDNREFRLAGREIESTLYIAPWEAALGARVDVPTLGGSVQMQIPAGSQGGRKLRLKGKGLPGKASGNQLVTLEISVPEAKTDEDKAAYEALQKAFPDFSPRKS